MSLGVMGSLGHYFIAQAAKSAEVVVITPFEYTSFIFLGIMGYFFYTSYQNQDKVYLEKKSQENKFEEEINNNSTKIKIISENLVKNQSLFSQIEKL